MTRDKNLLFCLATSTAQTRQLAKHGRIALGLSQRLQLNLDVPPIQSPALPDGHAFRIPHIQRARSEQLKDDQIFSRACADTAGSPPLPIAEGLQLHRRLEYSDHRRSLANQACISTIPDVLRTGVVRSACSNASSNSASTFKLSASRISRRRIASSFGPSSRQFSTYRRNNSRSSILPLSATVRARQRRIASGPSALRFPACLHGERATFPLTSPRYVYEALVTLRLDSEVQTEIEVERRQRSPMRRIEVDVFHVR